MLFPTLKTGNWKNVAVSHLSWTNIMLICFNMLRVTVTLSYCIVHAYVDVDDDEVYGSVVTYMYVKLMRNILIQIHII